MNLDPEILHTDPRKKNPISSFPQTIQLFKTIFLNKIYLCLSLIKERKEIMNIKRKLYKFRRKAKIELNFLPWHDSAHLLYMSWIRIRISPYGSDFYYTNPDPHHCWQYVIIV